MGYGVLCGLTLDHTHGVGVWYGGVHPTTTRGIVPNMASKPQRPQTQTSQAFTSTVSVNYLPRRPRPPDRTCKANGRAWDTTSRMLVGQNRDLRPQARLGLGAGLGGAGPKADSHSMDQ